MNGNQIAEQPFRRTGGLLQTFIWPFLLTCDLWQGAALAQSLPADVALPGSITVVVQPAEAVGAGAHWTVDNGTEFASGAHQGGIPPGHHTLRFRDLSSWQEPDAVEVLIVGGKETSVTATYRPVPTFYFRNIPEQHARPEKMVEFVVRSDDAGDPQSPGPGVSLILTAAPPPVGAMTFDPANGRFTYAPDVTDRLPFTLTFSTAQGLTGTTIITPLNSLVPEDTVIEYDHPLPNPASRDYITISETTNEAKSFNDVDQGTLNVQISGPTLVFEANHPSHLFDAYNQRNNIEELHLYADRVIIRSPFILPQTHLIIHARELRFEGNGVIDTTPRTRSLKPAAVLWEDELTRGLDGAPGYKGGDADVFVEQFHSDPSLSTRFILHGGNGGPAGEGRNGRNEGTVSFLSADWSKLMARSGNPFCGTANSAVMLYFEDRFGNAPPDICGSKGTARGENAVSSGRPGNGGAGGTLRSTLNLGFYAQQAGGVAGASGANYVGGVLSARRFMYRTSVTRIVKGEEVVSTSDTTAPKAAGQNANAPGAFVPIGAAGSLALVPNPGAWLHSFSLRPVIQFARDAYLNGRIAETRTVLDDCRQFVLAHQPVVPPGAELGDDEFLEKVNLDQVLIETETLLHRIDSNLDYFGNPAGWVPMLSFEANLLAFQNEVEQSIPVLYLAYWLNQAATNLQASLGASVEAKQDLVDELDKMVTAFNEAQTAIPALHVASDSIVLQIASFKAKLAARLGELEQQAQQNVEDRHKVSFWKKALGVLSVAADLVPVGQPVVGRIGSGLGLLGKFDPDKPLESAATLAPKAFEIFSEKNITVCFGGTNATATPTNSPSGTNTVKKAKQDKLAALTECGKFLGGEFKELGDIFKDVQVPREELAAELAKLTAGDSTFTALTAQVNELNVQKEQFAQQLAAAVQAIATLSGAMTENQIATHEIESRLESGFTALDHGALLHVKEMERRAKDRLLQYQYFLAKSFQYRRLKAYTGSLQLTRLLDRFQVLVEAGNSQRLTAQEFDNLKFIFLDELREIVAQMFDNFNAPERSIPISFRLTASELQQLNGPAHSVRINLKERGLLGNTRENVRIADLRVRGMAVHPVGGSFGNHALLGVNFEHLGESRLTSAGKTFLFRHYQTEAVNPIVWNAIYDGLTGGVENSELSVAQQSLIAVLLNLQSQPQSALVFFSSPAAWADILVTKEVVTDNQVDMAIDDVHVDVQFDFYNTTGNQRELAVEVAGDLAPLIVVSQRDINGRQDGLGDFTRVFAPFSQVTLKAPPAYGQLSFDRWLVNGQEGPANQTTLLVNVASNMKVEARFRSIPAATAAPTLAPITAPGGQVGFSFGTVAGANYTIEQATSLVNPVWTPIETRTGNGGNIQFLRPSGTNGALFFRLRMAN